MLGIRLAFGGLLTTLLITTFSFSQVVSLEFKNVAKEILVGYVTLNEGNKDVKTKEIKIRKTK